MDTNTGLEKKIEIRDRNSPALYEVSAISLSRCVIMWSVLTHNHISNLMIFFANALNAFLVEDHINQKCV